jgi:hypothetical protein
LRKAKFLGVPDLILYVKVRSEIRTCSSGKSENSCGYPVQNDVYFPCNTH